MKIYSLTSADNQAYLYVPPKIDDGCNPRPPRSIAAGWSPPTFELVGCDEYRSYLPRTDFPSLGYETAIMSARAVDRLRPILVPCGEILPIRLSNDPEKFFLFNVTRLINAVDMERSKFDRFPGGLIASWESLAFDPNLLTDALFFKTVQLGAVYEIYVTQAVVDAVKKARVTGFDFKLEWTDE